MKKPTDVGKNRTGIQTSPIDSQKLIDAAAAGVPRASVDPGILEAARAGIAESAEPVGTMPPPGSVKAVVSTVKTALKGEKATVLLDRIGERLAFERTGTRLYQALMAKLTGADSHPGGPTRADLQLIHDQELAHFHLLTEAMTRLGGDPTAITPSADVDAVASSGLLKVLADPRTTLNQGLKAVLTAELVDNDGWELLIDLAEKMGEEELAAEFQGAADAEEEHLARVRTWLARAVQGEAGIGASTAAATPPGP